MKKILILFVVWMIFQMPVYAAETGTTSGMSAKVYESMSEDGTVVANVIKGSVFTILSEHTDENGTEWYFICTDIGQEGYIQKEETFREAEETQQSIEQTPQKQIKFIQNVNIRELPTIEAEIVGRVPRNTILEPLEKQENESGEVWYQINYEGIIGYIRESTVDIIEIEREEEQIEKQIEKQIEELPQQETAIVMQEVAISQEEVENIEQSVKQASKETEKIAEEMRNTVVCEITTRKSVNPIDGVMLFIMLGMIVSLVPVICIMRKVRKKRHKKADYNRKMRR